MASQDQAQEAPPSPDPANWTWNYSQSIHTDSSDTYPLRGVITGPGMLRLEEITCLKEVRNLWFNSVMAGCPDQGPFDDFIIHALFFSRVFSNRWNSSTSYGKTLGVDKPEMRPLTFKEKAVRIGTLLRDVNGAYTPMEKVGAPVYGTTYEKPDGEWGGKIVSGMATELATTGNFRHAENMFAYDRDMCRKRIVPTAHMHHLDSYLKHFKRFNMHLAVYLARQRIEYFAKYENDSTMVYVDNARDVCPMQGRFPFYPILDMNLSLSEYPVPDERYPESRHKIRMEDIAEVMREDPDELRYISKMINRAVET